MLWMLMPLHRYAEFKSRARRREYWTFILLVMIVVAVAGLAMIVAAGSFRSQAEMSSRFTVWVDVALSRTLNV